MSDLFHIPPGVPISAQNLPIQPDYAFTQHIRVDYAIQKLVYQRGIGVIPCRLRVPRQCYYSQETSSLRKSQLS